MEMTETQIKEAIADGTISALTLDTSIFDGNGNRFEHGLLARLRQFNGSKVKVVLSDVVLGEVKAHVTREAAEAQAKIRTGMKEVGKAWQVGNAQRDAAMNALFGNETAEQLAQRRIDTFMAGALVDVVESDGRVNIGAVLAAYFGATPPFGKTAAKKSEFPDAFALQALETWAKDEDIHLLVVSKDGDWQRFCRTAERLVVSDDLAQALSYFHQNADVACARLALRFTEGQLDIEEQIKDAVRDATDRLTFEPEVSSGYFWDADVYGVEVTSIEIMGEEGKPFKVVDKPDEETLVVEAEVEAAVSVTTAFQFSVTDPIDKDEVSIGSASATVEVPMKVRVLLTFEGDLAAEAELGDIEVELAKQRITVDYGDVGPDWDPDPEDHE